MKWLGKKFKVARWLVLNRVSRSMVAGALLKAPVQLALLVRQARFVASEANQVIPALSSENVTASDQAAKGTLYPARFDINPQTEDLLRRLVLEFRPRRLVETGVANGRSTRVLLAPGGVLVSDDVNWSQAFLHFCQENSLNPVVLADGTKFAGVVRKAGGQAGS